MNKKWFIVGILMGLVIVFLFLRSLPDGKTLMIVFCNVGQGDSIYLRFPNGIDMLIDGGPDGSVLSCLGKYKPFWNRQIDLLLLTHADLDHFGGFIPLLERYRVKKLLRTSVENSTPEYRTFRDLVQKEQASVQYMTAQDKIRIGGASLVWLWPTASALADGSIESRNDTSQVVHLRYGEVDMLFTGDAGVLVEEQYKGIALTPDGIEVLKVPHHGSASGMTDSFLYWLAPSYGVISSGKNNRFGHPAKVTVDLLAKHQVRVFRTDQHGHIVLKTDGTRLKIGK